MTDSELIGWLKNQIDQQQKTIDRQAQIIQNLLAGDDEEGPAPSGLLDPSDRRR